MSVKPEQKETVENNTKSGEDQGGKKEENENIKETMEVQLPVTISQISNSPLEYAYSFWFSKRPSKGQAGGGGGGGAHQAYDANLRLVGTFNTVEKFWYLYAHMARPQDIQGHADIHMFKAGIRPLWEDDANKNGGKWIVRLKKGLATRSAKNA